MSKNKEVTLNSQQLHELKWFCDNVTGLKVEFYEVLDQVNAFKAKFDRLHKTAEMIEHFINRCESK